MGSTSFGVSLRGFKFNDWNLTFNLAAGIDAADVGKAVTLDPSAPNTVKLVGDGDEILGRLEVVENRGLSSGLTGTVALQFVDRLPSTGRLAVGDRVMGSARPGVVKRAADDDADGTAPLVVETADGFAVVIKK